MQPSPLVPLHHTHSCGVSQTCYHSHSPSPLSPSQRIQSFRSRFLQNIGPSRSNPKSQAQNYKQIHNLNNSNSFDHSLSLSLTGTTMAISRQIMRYSSPSSSPIFKSLLNQTIRFNHNHQEQEYNKPCDFLGSWEQPKTPREAEKKLGLLRRDYAKQVKELRKEYFYEMELQRQEKQRKDEAKREATLVAKEERKVAKAAMLQVKAAERKASEEELRQTLEGIGMISTGTWESYDFVKWDLGCSTKGWDAELGWIVKKGTIDISRGKILKMMDALKEDSNSYGGIYRLATGMPIASFNSNINVTGGIGNIENAALCEGFKQLVFLLSFYLLQSPLQAREILLGDDKHYDLGCVKNWGGREDSGLKERAEKLEYWRLKNKRVEEKKREKNEIIRCQSSIWIDELNLENKVLEAIVDTTPL
ncbi:hypothetical protein GIB67_032803 [Kingdonia uniflora]|uniref:Uncharacterized protein n=1 Tax=Kingdonia uniflora TaxID=39325 RepID=A0A7J7MWD5_9MAGN|nr:hypothetical protein GIB67_032803 [Kingdonia uniflora]